MSTDAMTVRIPISFRANATGNPSIMSFLTAEMYQVGGRIQETACNILGILSIGNTIPDNKIVGTINNMAENSIATIWTSATVETRSPSAKVVKM